MVMQEWSAACGVSERENSLEVSQMDRMSNLSQKWGVARCICWHAALMETKLNCIHWIELSLVHVPASPCVRKSCKALHGFNCHFYEVYTVPSKWSWGVCVCLRVCQYTVYSVDKMFPVIIREYWKMCVLHVFPCIFPCCQRVMVVHFVCVRVGVISTDPSYFDTLSCNRCACVLSMSLGATRTHRSVSLNQDSFIIFFELLSEKFCAPNLFLSSLHSFELQQWNSMLLSGVPSVIVTQSQISVCLHLKKLDHWVVPSWLYFLHVPVHMSWSRSPLLMIHGER